MTDTDSKICAAITKKGQPCKRPPMKGCEFCYSHSFKRFKGVCWWKSPLFHLFIGILGILATSLAYYFGPTKINQQELLENASESSLQQLSKDRIIATQYRDAINYFLIHFRNNLHCLPLANPIEPEIELTFHPGFDLMKKSIDRDRVNSTSISSIFKNYDFSKSMVNYIPSGGGRVMTNAEYFSMQLVGLREKCVQLLSKYASAGQPDLILRIETLKNRIENILYPLKPIDYRRLNKSDLINIIDFFYHVILSLDTIDEIIKKAPLPNVDELTGKKFFPNSEDIVLQNNYANIPKLTDIRPFLSSDLQEVTFLHISMQERYDDLDQRQNNNGAFLVGLFKGKIVVTGTLTKSKDGQANIRSTVHPDWIGFHFGENMLYELETLAHRLGYRTIVIPTDELRGVPSITQGQSGGIMGRVNTVLDEKSDDEKWNISSKNENLKLLAQSANLAIQPSVHFLTDFLTNNGHKDLIGILNRNVEDESGKNRPRTSELDEIMDVFKSVSIYNKSNILVNEIKLPWIERFINDLKETYFLCGDLLKKYGNTNNQLIDSIIELRYRTHDLIFIFSFINSHPRGKDAYKNGIPMEQHLDFIRHFFLRVLKTQRLIRETTSQQ